MYNSKTRLLVCYLVTGSYPLLYQSGSGLSGNSMTALAYTDNINWTFPRAFTAAPGVFGSAIPSAYPCWYSGSSVTTSGSSG